MLSSVSTLTGWSFLKYPLWSQELNLCQGDFFARTYLKC